jgi:hypothetical protein
LKHLPRSCMGIFRACARRHGWWRGSTEAAAGPASCRGRISRHPSALGAKTRLQPLKRWRVGTRPSTGRVDRPCTSWGRGRMCLLCLCTGRRPASILPRPRYTTERVWVQTGDTVDSFAGRRAACWVRGPCVLLQESLVKLYYLYLLI